MIKLARNRSKMANSIQISFIVVNWNTKDMTKGCLESIYNSLHEGPFEIILVDNASSDGSIDHLRAQFPDVRIITNSSNLGFAKANNQGLAIAKGSYAFLVNSDVVMNADAIDGVGSFLNSNKDIGVVGTRLIYGRDGKTQKYAFGYAPTLWRLFNQFSALFYLSRYIPLFKGITACSLEKGAPVPVDWVSGACLAVRMEAYKKVGGMDESYFFYVEDMEWCSRIKRAGWQVYFMPDLNVLHFYGTSQQTREQRVDMVGHWYKNLRQFFAKDHGRISLFIFDVMAACGFGIRNLVVNLKNILTRRKDTRFEADGHAAVVKLALQFMFEGK